MKKMILSVLVILMWASPFYAFLSRFLKIDTNSMEFRLLKDPDSFSLKTASLIASGVSEENIPAYLTQISNFESEIRPSVAGKNPEETAYVLFAEMHKKLLKKYEESSTTLDVLLRTGKFNCLSSTVLYSILLEDFGIPYRVAVLPSHTFSVLTFNEKADNQTSLSLPAPAASGLREIDVENTTPYGFNIGTNKQAQENFRKLTGFEYNADASVREITGKTGLIAYTYGNVAYYASRMNQIESAFQSVLRSVALYHEGKYVYTNVVAGYSQYIYKLLDNRKDYPLALAISEEALVNLPNRDMFLSNYFFTLDNYIDALVADAKYAEAFQAYEKGRGIAGPNRVIEDNLYSRVLFRLIAKEKDLAAAYPYARRAVTDIPGSQNVRNMILNALNIQRVRLVKDWDAFPAGEEDFLKWYGLMRSPDIDAQLENYYVEVSGRHYEAQKFDRALQINARGLSLLPGSAVLKKNAAILAGNIADAYFQKKDMDNGLKYTLLGYQSEPKNEVFLNNIRVVYKNKSDLAIDRGDYRKGLEYAEAGLKYLPDDKKLSYNRDYCLKKLKNPK